MSGYEKFQEIWKDGSHKEREEYDARPVSELLADIRVGRFGNHYRIWYSLGARASLKEAGSLLFDVLESRADYLVRYHCAAALISMAGVSAEGYQPVQLSAGDTKEMHEHLMKLREKLQI
jgi:hypothetical protein